MGRLRERAESGGTTWEKPVCRGLEPEGACWREKQSRGGHLEKFKLGKMPVLKKWERIHKRRGDVAFLAVGGRNPGEGDRDARRFVVNVLL